MKTLLTLSCLISIQVPDLLAQQPSTDRPEQGFFERTFNPKKSVPPDGSKKLPRETWPLFAAAQLPVGKALNETDVAKLPVAAYTDQNVYLVGNLVVKASSESRAVVRYVDPIVPMRIIVEYPPNIPVPAQGTKLNVDVTRGFLIRQVGRAKNDNSLLLYVREITRP